MVECMEIHPFSFMASFQPHLFSLSSSSFSPLETMNRYSKMSAFPKNKSSSLDFSDLSAFSDHPPSKKDEEEEEEKCRYRPSASAVIHGAVKRALSVSMRRSSSSASERYSRIHDQPVALWSPIEDDEGGGGRRGEMRSEKKKKKTQRTVRIIKACKSLLGF